MADASFSGARVMKAFASSALGQFLVAVQNLLLVPLFLAAWGDAGYGQWLALTALVSYLSLLDLGGQSYIGVRLAQAFAQDKPDEFRTILREGFSLFLALAVVAQVIVLAVVFSPLVSWSDASRAVVAWYAGATLLALPGAVLACCYGATGQVVRSTMVSNISRLVCVACYALALFWKVSQPVYAAVVCASAYVYTAVIIVDLRRTVGPLFQPSVTLASLRAGVLHLRSSLEYWMFALASGLNLQGVLLVVASALGPASVAAFSTHRAAASLIVYAGALLRPAVSTELTFMAARSDLPRLREVISIAVRANTWLSAIMASALCLAAPLGYTLWTRSKLELDIPLLLILASQAVLFSGWNTASWPLMSANQPRVIARWSLANAALTIAGSFLALKLGWGIRGVAAVSFAADILCGLAPFPIAAANFLEESPRRFGADLLRAIACASPFALVAYGSLRLFHDDLLRLFAFGIGSLLLAWPAARSLLGHRHLSRITAIVSGRAAS
jgi:O-antigen/teichoic acid export membrane protein